MHSDERGFKTQTNVRKSALIRGKGSSLLLDFLQLRLFDIHVFEFAGLEDFSALHAFDELGVFFAGDDFHARVFALGHIDLLGRLRRTGWAHRFRLTGERQAVRYRAILRRNWRYF